MLQNYFKPAWRNMLHNRTSSLINISGLSIGIACTLLIVIFINNELSYDRFHKDANRIFQVVLNGNMDGQEFWAGNTPPPVGAALTSNFPEVETFTRFYKPNDVVVRYEQNNSAEKFFTEKNVLAVDSNFLQLFDFKIIEGNATTALAKPGSVVITDEMAKKYFGSDPERYRNPIGKILRIGQDKKPFSVTAVIKKVPSQSSIQFDFLAPVADFPAVKRFSWSWVWMQMVCYVKLKENVPTDKASIRQLETKFPAMVKVQAANAFKRIGKPFDEFLKSGGKWDLHLMPLTDVHLRSASIGMPWLSHISNIKYIFIFGSIALFIILLACVNFMNLSTARASKRAKEVGIRKVTGSTRAQLIKQFLSEAFLYSFLSSMIAIALVALLLTGFSMIIDEPISFQTAFTPSIWLSLLALTIITGLLAGSYPALYLTSFKPVLILKGKNLFSSSKRDLLIRNGLVVFQFTISTIMIVGTLVVVKQLRFFRNTDMGFNKENVLIITSTDRLGESEESFRDAIAQIPGITSAGITTSVPSEAVFGDSYKAQPDDNVAEVKDIGLNSFMVDESFIPTLNIKVIQGRNFSKAFSDSASIILNQEAVRQIGWKDPIGKWVDYPGGDNVRFKVIGVVKNFNIQSLQAAITPFALFHLSSKTYGFGHNVIAKVRSQDLSKVVNQAGSKWKSFASAEPFDYNFLDAAFDSQYRSEKRLGTIFSIFAALSIFIACLGLFGLSAFMAERRTKEIGVRKVLGASVPNVVMLLSKDFLRLTLIAIVIAFPIAWYFMSKWLEDFAYRIDITWTIFLLAGLSTLIITLATISFQAIGAAMANPVKSLRTE